MFNMRESANWAFIHNLQLLILIGSLSGNYVIAKSNELPCQFLDSVNITDGVVQSNQSIIYDGVEFTPADYVQVDYVLNRGVERISAKPHIRGCLCNRKPCIRFCCPFGSVLTARNKTKTCVSNEEANRLDTEILHQNNTKQSVKLGDHFSFVNNNPCQNLYVGDTDFQITHEGRILHDDSTLEHHHYCFRATVNQQTDAIDWNLLVCYEPATRDIRFTILPICMLISVFFIVATLLVYAFVPKLRNLNGKCLICYLAALAIGYSILSWLQIIEEYIISPICTLAAHVVYFALIAAFMWLNVLNFDQWQSFQSASGFNQFNDRKKLLFYCVYGFGIPCILTFLLWAIDQIESIPQDLRPRLGEESCFLQKNRLTQFVFFYIPLGIIFTINVVLFILTAMRIRMVQKEAIKIRSPEDSSKLRKSLNKKRETVTLYFRLFVIAGISWVLEVISFLVAPDSAVFLFSDIWNCLQGFFIFILLILRRRVLRLIKERWNGMHDKSNQDASVASNSNDSANYLRLNTISSPK